MGILPWPDPTNPFDAPRDEDTDGFEADGPYGFEAPWTNLDEFAMSPYPKWIKWNDPRLVDSDGDGLSDGKSIGVVYDSTVFQCHYLSTGGPGTPQQICDNRTVSSLGRSIWQVGQFRVRRRYRCSNRFNEPRHGRGWDARWMGNQKQTLICRLHRRKSLDTGSPRPIRCNEDADGDGLTNACEYRWSVLLETVRENGLTTHGESAQRRIWVATDPNLIDSDGDICCDGWEAPMHVHGT